MNEEQKRAWAQLWKGISEISEEFEDRPVFIGGVAVYVHLAERSLETDLGEFSHDADLLLSLADFADLRDLYEVTPNRRLGKNQIIKHGIEFDVYVERNYGLAVQFDDAMAESKIIQNVRAASLEHLLVLKLDACLDRRGSEKGLKDERDLIRLCSMMHTGGYKQNLITPYFREETVDVLRALPRSSQFLVLTGRNAHSAKPLRSAVEAVSKSLSKAYGHQPN